MFRLIIRDQYLPKLNMGCMRVIILNKPYTLKFKIVIRDYYTLILRMGCNRVII